jgi:hypothetical protein
MMRTKDALAKLSMLPVLALTLMTGAAPGWAQGALAGTDIGKPALFGEGVACDASQLPWRNVWFGHFSGGTAYYERGAPGVDVTWEDRKLCFPSRRSCLSWQHAERREFHRVKGSWTCLPLR